MQIKSKKSIINSNIVVTGGSRDIGGGIVLELGKAGYNVLSIFRSKPERAQRIIDEIKKLGYAGATDHSPVQNHLPILLQADLTTVDGREEVFKVWKEKFGNKIDVLVLCASGATMEINVEANMALVDKFLELKKLHKKNAGANDYSPNSGTIIFLQSEPGHYHRVIDGVFDFIEYYRDKVGPAKRAGEDAFRKRLKLMEEVGVKGIVVCPPEVTDTFNMKLFELQNKEARAKSRELSAMLGTKDFVTIADVAKRVRELIENKSVKSGHLELFDNVEDGLTYLSEIYGDEAIYVHTFEKIGENEGVGRLIVNPKLWKRDEEPSFEGELINKNKNEITTTLKITKNHARGHFRPEIAYVFPGHKSIRTAFTALGRFLNKDPEIKERGRIAIHPYLRKYTSVKFRSPVVPGQVLKSVVTLTGKSKNTVTGDAIQSVGANDHSPVEDQKESMVIRGMLVEKVNVGAQNIVGAYSNTPLQLDQLVEAAAQTVGMFVLEGMDKNSPVLPLFHSTGEAEIFRDVVPGDNLLIKLSKAKVVKAGVMNIFSADVEIMKKVKDKEEPVASIKSLQGLILPKDEVLKKISGK